jgi:hypothetical protein
MDRQRILIFVKKRKIVFIPIFSLELWESPMIKSPQKKQKKNSAHAACIYRYVCISKLLEEALQVLSLQASSVFFSNLLYVHAHK